MLSARRRSRVPYGRNASSPKCPEIWSRTGEEEGLREVMRQVSLVGDREEN